MSDLYDRMLDKVIAVPSLFFLPRGPYGERKLRLGSAYAVFSHSTRSAEVNMPVLRTRAIRHRDGRWVSVRVFGRRILNVAMNNHGDVA